jgi:hypothetical protein
MTRSNSLPMYDFPEVQASTKAILDALSEHSRNLAMHRNQHFLKVPFMPI